MAANEKYPAQYRIATRRAPDGKSIPWLLLGAVPGTSSGKLRT
jgi:hypothetical protein